MDPTKTIQEIKDRQDIYDCLMRYCRGVDRLDRALLASAYHPDAVDDHRAYVGPVAGFIDWVLPLYREQKLSSHHEITNFSCEIDGTTAHVESYFISTSVDRAAPFFSRARGRYVDRFEKRDGRWGIAERICIVEINENAPPGAMPTQAPRDKSDPSYMRPLRVDRSRFTK